MSITHRLNPRSTATRRRLGALAYLLPLMVFFGLFAIWPLIETVAISFQHWDGLNAPTSAGFGNYVTAVTDPEIRAALMHSIVFIVFYTVLPLAIALALTELLVRVRVRGLAVFRTILFIPQVLPMVVVAIAWRWIYATNGPLNQALDAIGLTGISRAWLGDFKFALPAVGLIGTWVTFGLVFVLLVAGLQRIPIEQFEAARLDGASAWQEFRYVTVPGLRGEITVAIVLTVTAALRNFDIVYVATGGGPGTKTTVPSVFIYKSVFLTRDVGLGAAIGILLMLLIAAVNLVVIQYRRREAT